MLRLIPEPYLQKLRLVPHFKPELEEQYEQEKFQETRFLAVYVGLAASFLALALWVWDLAIDPADMLSSLWMRILLGLILLFYPLGILGGVKRSMLPWLLAAVTLGTEALFLIHLTRLDTGLVYGISGFMYWFLLPVFMALPFTFITMFGLSISIALLPNVLVPLGVAADFELLKYNALIWPTCIIAIFIHLMLDQLYRRLFLYQVHTEDMARTDELTGIANRRAFMDLGEQILRICRRFDYPLSVIMFDLDHFKSINDKYGHHVGDIVLSQVAGFLKSNIRKSDVLGRYGGEEFALLLPRTPLNTALELAEKLRQQLADTPITLKDSRTCRVTFSAGVAAPTPTHPLNLSQLLKLADKGMYLAKKQGRDRVGPVCMPTEEQKSPASSENRP